MRGNRTVVHFYLGGQQRTVNSRIVIGTRPWAKECPVWQDKSGKTSTWHSLGVRHPPLFQLIDEKYCTTEFSRGGVRYLRLIHMSCRVHVVLVGGIPERLNHVYRAFYFRTDVTRFRLVLLKTERKKKKQEINFNFSGRIV